MPGLGQRERIVLMLDVIADGRQISRRKQIADRQGVSALPFVNTLIYRGTE